MAINTTAQTALNTRSVLLGSWVEIEGVSNAFGTFAATSSFFTVRDAPLRFDSIKRTLGAIPKVVDQTIDTLKGGNLSVGQVVFNLVDTDGEPTLLTNLATPTYYLNASITAAATTVYLNSISGLAVNDYIHIGTEVLRITALDPIGIGTNTLTVLRGRYRSTALAYPGFFPVGTSIHSMANRRVWFYQLFDSDSRTVGSPSASFVDSNKVLRFSGVLRACHLKDGDPNTYVLTAESLDREIDRPVFRNIRQFRLTGTSIKDATNAVGYPTQLAGFPGYSYGYDFIGNFDASQFVLDEYLILQIDDEIFIGQVQDLSPPRIRLLARGQYGTPITTHKEGALVRELIPLCAKSTASNAKWHERVSKFSATSTTPGSIGTPDHPVILCLQILMSTGSGSNNISGHRVFDCLPEDWGLSIDADRVDLNACEAAATEDASVRFAGFISEPINAVDLFRQLLVFSGYYFFVATGDLFTIRKLRPPLPEENIRSVNTSTRIRNQWPSWDANWSGAVREVTFKHGFDIVSGRFKRVTIFRLNTADIYSKGVARSVEFESKFIYPGGSNIPGDIGTRGFDVDSWLLRRKDYFNQRWAKPPPVVTVRVDFSFLGLELGELVALTVTWLPNLQGTRGVVENIGEVIGKAVDDESKTIELSLLMTGYQLGRYRYITASHVIQEHTIDGANTIIENVDTYNSGYDVRSGTGTPGNDMTFRTLGGHEWNWDTVGKVIVLKSDFSDYEVCDVVSVTSANITIVSPSGLTLANGDILLPPPYDEGAGADYDEIFGCFAVNSSLDGDNPHLLFPG